MTYPAILFLRTKVLGGPADNFHFLWELWYVAHALFDLHKSPFFDPDVFVPFGFSLIRNQDLSPGTVLLFSPLTHFFGEVFTYNFLILASFPLTAFGAYLLAYELWSNRLAAILAGVIIGFCPYRFQHADSHLSIVSTQWILFFFLYLERLISKPRLRSAVLAGIFFGLSAWTTWYYFFMLLIATPFYTIFRIDWKPSGKDLRQLLKLGLISIGVALIFVTPFLIAYYRATHGGVVDYRSAGESQAFAAAVADYIIPPSTHFLWGHKVTQLWRNGPNGLWLSEWELYLGVIALLLAAVGVFHRRRHVAVALIAMALGCLLFSFGPGIYFTHPPPVSSGGNNAVVLSGVPAPGRWLQHLPGFNNLRSWARLGFFVETSVGLLAAAGLVRLLDWIKEHYRTNNSAQTALALTVIAFAVLDFFPRGAGMTSVTPRPVEHWLSVQPGNFAFMEYPISNHGYGGPAIYSTRLTGKRIIMGSAQNPPNLAFWQNLSAFPSPWTIDLLWRWGAEYVLVDENLYRVGASFWNINQTWSSLESAIKASPRLKQVTVLDGVHVYQINSGTGESNSGELLANGSFEEGEGAALRGWERVGNPVIDRSGRKSFSGRVACKVTPRDFLVPPAVAVEAGQCYRMSVRQRAATPKLSALRLQLNWQSEDGHGLPSSSVAFTVSPCAPQWQDSSITVQAPVGSRYVLVQAVAAKGEIWVDDYSFKRLADDCKPVLFVTPNPCFVLSGPVGDAAVSWNTYRPSQGRVTVIVDGGSEELFAEGQSGLKMFYGVKPGSRYQFRLYSDPEMSAQETVKLKVVGAPVITAEPNPVPKGSGPGQTRISWATVAEPDAEVYVSPNGEPEQLFAKDPAGAKDVNWIAAGSSYEFRLYSGDGSRRLLAKETVKREGVRAAVITAEPNPVPKGSGPGQTRISWATLDGTDGEVYVSRNGGPEQLFAKGAAGAEDATWIAAGSSYEFRLYSGDGSRRLLAKTLVNR